MQIASNYLLPFAFFANCFKLYRKESLEFLMNRSTLFIQKKIFWIFLKSSELSSTKTLLGPLSIAVNCLYQKIISILYKSLQIVFRKVTFGYFMNRSRFSLTKETFRFLLNCLLNCLTQKKKLKSLWIPKLSLHISKSSSFEFFVNRFELSLQTF